MKWGFFEDFEDLKDLKDLRDFRDFLKKRLVHDLHERALFS